MQRMGLVRIGARQPAGGYPVRVDEVGGSTVAEATMADDLGAAMLAAWGVGDRDGVVEAFRRRVLDGQDRAGRSSEAGEHLYRLLATGDVRAALRTLDAARAPMLLEVTDDELKRLPWELLSRDGGFLFADVSRPWSRVEEGADLSEAEPPVWHEGCPLRVLVVVGSAEADTDLQAEAEVRGIVRAIVASRLPIEWHVERRPEHSRLRSLLRWMRPDVLHFIGHSTSDPTGDALIVRTPSRPWEYTTHLVRADLALAVPRVVVLNACRLSDQGASRQSADGSWSVARAFASGGACAVVAMQGDIRGEDARGFAAALYRSLLVDGAAIDVAVAEARNAIEAAGLRQRDFGFPSLTLRIRPQRVLALPRPDLDPTVLDHISASFHVAPIVDRCEERSLLHGALADTGAGRRHLVSVLGEEDAGKTWLVRWCLYVHALKGENVAYVDFGEQRDPLLSPLEVLRMIRAELEACARHGAVHRRELGSLDLEDGAFDRARSEDAYGEVVGEFAAALARAARETGGVLIALDHLHSVSEEFRVSLGTHLVRPVAAGDVKRVRLLIVRRDDPVDAARFPFSTDVDPTIEVDLLPAEDHMPLTLSALYHHGWESEAPPFPAADDAAGRWMPEELKTLAAYVRLRQRARRT